jgi:hypothetical protein
MGAAGAGAAGSVVLAARQCWLIAHCAATAGTTTQALPRKERARARAQSVALPLSLPLPVALAAPVPAFTAEADRPVGGYGSGLLLFGVPYSPALATSIDACAFCAATDCSAASAASTTSAASVGTAASAASALLLRAALLLLGRLRCWFGLVVVWRVALLATPAARSCARACRSMRVCYACVRACVLRCLVSQSRLCVREYVFAHIRARGARRVRCVT